MKYEFTLNDGTCRDFEEDEIICFGCASRKIGMFILVLGVLLILLCAVYMMMENAVDLRVLIGVGLALYGWTLWRAAPRKDKDTINDGFRTYKGKAEVKKVIGYSTLGSNLWLLDKSGKKVGRVKSIEEVIDIATESAT